MENKEIKEIQNNVVSYYKHKYEKKIRIANTLTSIFLLFVIISSSTLLISFQNSNEFFTLK